MERVAAALDALYAAAVDDLDRLRDIAAAHNVPASPSLLLSRGHEYRYDPDAEEIGVLIPDLREPLGHLFLLYLQDLLSCPDLSELLEFLALLQGHGVAHEFAHHLRHHYGRFNLNDLWLEEQWANQFAAAFVNAHLSPAQLNRALALLQRAVTGLANAERPLTHLGDQQAARDFFNDVGEKSPVTYLFYTLGEIYQSLAAPEQQPIERLVDEALRPAANTAI